MRKTHLLPAVLVLFLYSCEKFEELQEQQLNPAERQTLYNISYGPNSRQVLDIALPANRSTHTPVVIFIHGGAWIMGDRSVFATEIRRFADEGIACVTINYRYASDIAHVHHPELPGDVRAAVEFIASKSQAWQVSPDRFGLVGHSAGGHLALTTAYGYNDGRIKACASWAGLLDLTGADQQAVAGAPGLFKTYLGSPLLSADDTLQYKGASPYWLANPYSVPTLLIHGTADNGVPYADARRMKTKLDQLKVPNNLVTLDGVGHIWTGKSLNRARSETLTWFQGTL